MTTRPTAFSRLSEQQPAEIRLTSIEVACPVKAGLGVRVPISPPLSEQQPAEICPTSIEVAWPVMAGLGVRVSFSHLSEQQPAEILPTSIEVAWPVKGRLRSQSVKVKAP
ncbi:hypothetical protein AVEN_236063-1 [Araneus ventricosus]|uniref:Uncharacterized protein n=1 Tax=Araneus ventricosus TaxID=182803 RepID=A0A4Y2VH80_ARAVE|nr:hypothetical protein AVEN_271753-1 [Araneus ventricosus]GBO23397.1 hypothetical protein AVEN_118444-1 [Araneus ventricosus]GBO23674.1 hypothetical protein AVEN_48320-1 [Araneus ventricosus]GBO23695.1 hypothetical protein AVEN_236063-1 [Araneus ventricosus]